MIRIAPFIIAAVCSACGEPSLTSSLESTESELQTAQCTQAGSNGCFATFQACTDDAATCEAALRACLPPRPEKQGRGDGGECRGGPDGGQPKGGAGPAGHGGGKRPPLSETCRTALDTCLDGAPADKTVCFDEARACMRAEFQARCDEAETTCAGSTEAACTRILERCAVGVDAIPMGTVCE